MQHSIEAAAASIITPELRLAPPAGATRALAELARGRRSRMLIGLTQLQRVIARLHGIAPNATMPVLSRLKYLLKQGFPQRFETQPGGRTSMSLEDALQLVFAFELLQLGISNGVAIEALVEGWDRIERALAAAAGDLVEDNSDGSAAMIFAIGAALTSDGSKGSPPMRFAVAGAQATTDATIVYVRSKLVIDAVGLIASLADALAEELVATPATIRQELRRFATATFGTADVAAWRLETVG